MPKLIITIEEFNPYQGSDGQLYRDSIAFDIAEASVLFAGEAGAAVFLSLINNLERKVLKAARPTALREEEEGVKCACGAPAHWHGSRTGKRVFCCQKCASEMT